MARDVQSHERSDPDHDGRLGGQQELWRCIDAARWLHDCPRALVTATIIDLNLAALVTLLVAYDCLVGQKSSTNLGDRRAPLRISPFVMGRWASVLSFWALATLFSHASIGLVQVLAHGDAARVLSWAAETWLVVVACAATWSALWTLLTVWIETPRRALSIGVMVTVASTVGRMALRTRFNYAVVPSMLDTGLLSGLPMRFARTLATGAIWSGASLVVATAALGKRRERRPSTW